MPVNLKLIPPPAARPHPPVWWVWLLLLAVMLLGGMAEAILSNTTKTEVNGEAFWSTALGLPSLFWLTLLLMRITWYKGQSATAQSKDNDRERLLCRETIRGQRFLPVLGVSLHSAFREPEDSDGQKQWDALLQKSQAFKTQPSWKNNEGVRHSRLARMAGESAGQMLSRGLKKTLEELSQVLASVSDDIPLALLLENHSSLPESETEEIWQESWIASQIKQPVTRIEGNGLAAADRWLDTWSGEQSMLLIIAVQVVPEQTEGSAECIVGLLLGDPQIMPEFMPLARLHRPEQAYQTGDEDLHYALRQSLDWVPVVADTVKRGWLVGVTPEWHMSIATGLQAIHSPINAGQDLCDLGKTLGYPGPAAPWLAIACATEGARRGEMQLIVSGNNHENLPLWVTLVTPAEKSKEDSLLIKS